MSLSLVEIVVSSLKCGPMGHSYEDKRIGAITRTWASLVAASAWSELCGTHKYKTCHQSQVIEECQPQQSGCHTCAQAHFWEALVTWSEAGESA